MLTNDEKKKLESRFSKEKIVGGCARLYRTYDGAWAFVELFGAACLYQKDYSLFVGLVNIETQEIVFEHELYQGYNFQIENHLFVIFEGDDCAYGFLFSNEKDASYFHSQTNKIPPASSLKGTGISITKEERKSLEKVFSEDKVVGGAVRLFRSYEGQWHSTDLYGVVCVYLKDYSMYIGLLDTEKPHREVFQHEFYEGMELGCNGKLFVYFEGDCCLFGLLFVEEKEVTPFLDKVKKMKPKEQKNKRLVIGNPDKFKKDIGFSQNSDTLEGSINEGIIDVLKSQGIKKKDIMSDPDAFRYLIQISSEYSNNATLPDHVVNKLLQIIDKITEKNKQKKTNQAAHTQQGGGGGGHSQQGGYGQQGGGYGQQGGYDQGYNQQGQYNQHGQQGYY